jgi:cell wall-associated NlpC family hydrolase
MKLKKLTVTIFLLVFLTASVYAQNRRNPVAPPSWLHGDWEVTIGDETFEFTATADDILWDGDSAKQAVRSGEFIFSQKLTSSNYESRFTYDDGSWFAYTYNKPNGRTMRGDFKDDENNRLRMTYTRKGKAPVTQDVPYPNAPVPQYQPAQPAVPVVPQYQPQSNLPEYPSAPVYPSSPVYEQYTPPAQPAQPSISTAAQEDALRKKIAATAQKYLGATYMYGKQDPPRAFDCSGFVGQAYLEGAGTTIPRTSRQLATVGKEVKRNTVKPGDIIYFDIDRVGVITHVALVLDANNMIHAVSEGKGMAITSLDDAWYKPRIAGFRSVFSNGNIALTTRQVDGISIRSSLLQKPVTDFVLIATSKRESSVDANKAALDNGFLFTLVNETGSVGEFDVYFYEKGTDRTTGDHEKMALNTGEKRELEYAFFAEKPGQYVVEVLKGGAPLLERTWTIVKD